MKAKKEKEERERNLHEIMNELSKATEQINHGDIPSSDNSILTTKDILSILKAVIDEDEKNQNRIIIRKIKIS